MLIQHKQNVSNKNKKKTKNVRSGDLGGYSTDP